MTYKQSLLGLIYLSLAGSACASSWQHRLGANVGYIQQSDKELGFYNDGERRNGYLQLNAQGQYQLSAEQSFFVKARGFYSTDTINLEP